MNTILTILLLIALTIAIVCDIVRIWQFKRNIEEAKKCAKEKICKAVAKAYDDYRNENPFYPQMFDYYFEENFDKYL